MAVLGLLLVTSQPADGSTDSAGKRCGPDTPHQRIPGETRGLAPHELCGWAQDPMSFHALAFDFLTVHSSVKDLPTRPFPMTSTTKAPSKPLSPPMALS